MKIIIPVIAIAPVLLCIALCSVLLDSAQQREAHHKYVRQTELDMADLKARVATLERMEIDINIVDHTGIYSVMGVQVK